MGIKETNILKECQLAAAEFGCILFRNNVGVATTDTGHKIRFGLCVGSSDLIGWTRSGRFCAVEVKEGKGRIRPEQQTFIEAVRRAGGIGIIAYSPDDVKKALTAATE